MQQPSMITISKLPCTGGKQASQVASILQCTEQFQDVEIVADLAGRDRFVRAFRKMTG